jgi:uncharacterized OB-fold protein
MTEFAYIEDLFRADVVARVDGRATLIGSRCEICGDLRFPRAAACPRCHAPAEQLRPCALPRSGTVTTCSRVERGPAGFEVPYLVGYVALADGGPRVLARIDAASLEPAQVIGRPCVVEVGTLATGGEAPVRGYAFRVEAP